MICKQCGASNKDGSGFCSACGAVLRAESPKKQKMNQEMTDLLDKVAEYWRWIIAVIALFALLFGILNICCGLPVYQVKKDGGERETNLVTVSLVSTNLRRSGGRFGAGIVGNVLVGISNLAVAGVGVLYFLKKERNLTYYDQYIAKVIKTDEPAFLMGVAGAGGVVIQMILYLLCGVPEGVITTGISVGVHWLSWVALVLYGGLIAVSVLVKRREAK